MIQVILVLLFLAILFIPGIFALRFLIKNRVEYDKEQQRLREAAWQEKLANMTPEQRQLAELQARYPAGNRSIPWWIEQGFNSQQDAERAERYDRENRQ